MRINHAHHILFSSYGVPNTINVVILRIWDSIRLSVTAYVVSYVCMCNSDLIFVKIGNFHIYVFNIATNGRSVKNSKKFENFKPSLNGPK